MKRLARALTSLRSSRVAAEHPRRGTPGEITFYMKIPKLLCNLLTICACVLSAQGQTVVKEYEWNTNPNFSQHGITAIGPRSNWANYYVTTSFGMFAPPFAWGPDSTRLTQEEPYFEVTNEPGYNGTYRQLENVGFSWTFTTAVTPNLNYREGSQNASHPGAVSLTRNSTTDIGRPNGLATANVVSSGIGSPYVQNTAERGKTWLLTADGKNYLLVKSLENWSTGSFVTFRQYKSAYYLLYMQETPKLDQTITFETPGDKVYGDPSFQISATASSGLPVALAIVSGPATIAGTAVTLTGAGSVTIRATQPGNGGWAAAPALERTFTVAPRPITITRSGSKAYDGTTAATGASASVTTGSLVGSDNVTFTFGPTSSPNVGSYPITVAPTITGGAANYTITYAGSFVITPSSLGITVSIASKDFDGTTSATITGRTIGRGLVTGQTLSVTGGTATFQDPNVGTGKLVTVTGLAISNGSGLASNYQIGTVSLSAESSLFNWNNTGTRTFTNSIRSRTTSDTRHAWATRLVFIPNALFDVGAANNWSGYTGATFTVPNTRNLLEEGIRDDAGRSGAQGTGFSVYRIEWLNGRPATTTADYYFIRSWTESGTPYWMGWTLPASAIVTPPEGVIAFGTITPRPLTATADNLTRPFGAANPTPLITYSGFVGTETAATALDFVAPTATIAATATSAAAVGSTHSIVLAGGTARNYTITRVNGVLTVVAGNNASPTLGGLAHVYDGTPKVATVTTIPAGVSTAVTYNGSSTPPTNAGTYSVVATVTQTGYTGTASGTMTISRRALTVRAQNTVRLANKANPNVTLSYTGFVAGDTSATAHGFVAPTAVHSAATASPTGDYSITLSGGSSTNYTFTLVPGVLRVSAVSGQSAPEGDGAIWFEASSSASP